MSVIERFDAEEFESRFDLSELQTLLSTHLDAQLRRDGSEIVLEHIEWSSSETFTDLSAARRQRLGDIRRAAGMDSSLGERR